ncbi:MAG: 50S ribosomal protein L11 methyltransferase [Solirubrobacterales bacterium]|nr:50S ribosomal protein L11 methyltransferase [Solirubrobacterales bacterium]
MIRLALRVRSEDAEVALAELLELAPSGVEEVSLPDGLVEYAVYGPPGELPALPSFEAAVGGALVSVSSSEVADDWAERWRDFHQPLLVGGRLYVRPPWSPAHPDALDLVIDPGQAFGTGAHATTALCLELLLEEPVPSDERAVVDLGCGSGVLGIAAAKLGWGPVLGLDFDPLSVTASAENADVNGVAMEVRRFDLRSEMAPAAPLVLANLLGPLLRSWCEQLVGASALPAVVIASGLLEREADELSARFGAVGLAESARRVQGDWAALRLVRTQVG